MSFKDEHKGEAENPKKSRHQFKVFDPFLIYKKEYRYMARAWYSYNGSGPVDSVDSYLYASVQPTCLAGRDLCAIYATKGVANPSKPQTISSNLQTYIANGIMVGGPQPATPQGTKPYAYFFPTA